ncbi:DUF4129 domain-containing protein [Halosimplex sp. TS25]|uniref:DUF4129 domain-containing protein n=1 Tax=Halosimplex rarum TaxID=3396619 RepID=UPI0039E8AC13
MSPRTVALALLCVAVIAFAAATLDTTTNPNPDFGMGYTGVADDRGGERTPTDEPSGDSEQGDAPLDFDTDPGAPFQFCVQWLQQPLVQLLLVFGLVGVFAVGRWLDDAATGLAGVFILGYPGFFLYLLLTSCQPAQRGFLGLSDQGRPASEGGGLMGGQTTVAPPSLSTKLLLVLVVGTLVAVAALVLTGNHDQRDEQVTGEEDDEPEPEPATDVGAIGAAAGRAADRIEETDEFENEVYRAWAAMTDHLAVDHPESSTPAEFATAATAAGMDPDDVARLTEIFEEVRYGGEEPTADREEAAVETLRRIESTYAEEGDDADQGASGA